MGKSFHFADHMRRVLSSSGKLELDCLNNTLLCDGYGIGCITKGCVYCSVGSSDNVHFNTVYSMMRQSGEERWLKIHLNATLIIMNDGPQMNL